MVLTQVIPVKGRECQSDGIKQTQVNGGSNYDSLNVFKCLVIKLVARMNGLTRPSSVPICCESKPQPRERSSPTLRSYLRGVG